MSSIASFFSSFVSTTYADSEKEAPADAKVVVEEEAEAEEPEDVHPALREECQASAKCAALTKHFEHCQEKVQAGEGFKGEDCVEELPHDALRRGMRCPKTLQQVALDIDTCLNYHPLNIDRIRAYLYVRYVDYVDI